MTTFLTFLGLLFLFMIGKFVYDTYLTDNTERDWHEYKMTHPHESRVIENNSNLSFKTDHKVRIRGIYVLRHEGVSVYGETFKLTIILAFNNINRAFRISMENHPEISQEEVNEIVRGIANHTDTNSDCTEYFYQNGLIKMKFMNSSVNGEEYSGSVLHNGLLLTRIKHYWDEMAGMPNTRVTLNDARFKFIRAE